MPTGLCTRHIGNPNDGAVVQAIAARKPDIIVSVACPYILKRPLLELAPLGAINIHHAPLPRYRGMMPTFWQMFHGETHSGLTIHYMVPEIDEGEAIFRDSLPIRPGESLHELIIRAKRHGGKLPGRGSARIRGWRKTRSIASARCRRELLHIPHARADSRISRERSPLDLRAAD